MKLRDVQPIFARVVNGAFGIIACAVLVVAFPSVLKGTIDQVVAAGNRVPIHVGERCYRCQRVIAEGAVAAEGIGPAGAGVRKFRNVACMLKYLNDSHEKLDIVVTDHVSGRFVRPQGSSFVRTTIDPRTGEQGYVAFYHPWSASRFAAKAGSTVMNWETVQAAERIASLAE